LNFNVVKALLHFWKTFVYGLQGLSDVVQHEMTSRVELVFTLILMHVALILKDSKLSGFCESVIFTSY